jgi:hypothetical protein
MEIWTAKLTVAFGGFNDQYVKMNKEADNDWFTIASNKAGTRCVTM